MMNVKYPCALKPNKKCGYVIIAIFVSLITTCYYSCLFVYRGDWLYAKQTFAGHDESNYVLKTPGCNIPEMRLRGPQIDEFMKHSDTLECEWTNFTLPLIASNLTGLWLNATTLAAINLSADNPKLVCYYTPLLWDADNNYKVKFGERKYFVGSAIVLDELVEVTCELNDVAIYWDHLAFVQPSPTAMDQRDGNLSVLILGVDAMSRINFHRMMPRTMALLQKLGAVEMLGYNKVEDNTFPNLVPVFSGLSVDELRASCWPNADVTFDRCHFVWNDFSANHFETFFTEDCPYIGVFDYVAPGFNRQPTDHNLRPLMLRSEHMSGNTRCGNTLFCTGPELTLVRLLGHARRIAAATAGRLYWNFVWSSSLTHDYVTKAAYGDGAVSDFLERLDAAGELNRTAVFVMSDHGIRWGEFRNTYQGGLEDRLPLLTVTLPRWFRQRHPAATANLERNARRLTTPYDLHETLLEFVDPVGRPQLDDASVARRSRVLRNWDSAELPRGISLFLDVPDNRTCSDAAIPIHYCACHDVTVSVPVDDAQAVAATGAFVKYVNSELSTYPRCATLALDSLIRVTSTVRRDGERLAKDYQILVTTVPGYGRFEATVRHDSDHNQYRLMGSVSRLNLYGKQSECVTDARVKLLCYCK